MEVSTTHIFRKESEFWKNSLVAAGTKEYSPNHNSFINVYLGKLFIGYLTAGAMNKTHILVFKYSMWFCQRLNGSIVAGSFPIAAGSFQLLQVHS